MHTQAVHTIVLALRTIADALETLDVKPVEQKITEPIRMVPAKDLATHVGLSVSTIRKLSMNPYTPVTRYGKRCLYDIGEFQEWLRTDGPKRAKEEYARDLRKKHG